MTHIALLRAVNVGGHAVVKMADVRDAFAAAGAANVRSFIASGNIVFDAPNRGTAALFARIRSEMRHLLGHEAGICFRTVAELEALVAADPCAQHHGNPAAVRVFVAFLESPPESPLQLPVAVPKEVCEIVATVGRDLCIVSRRKPNQMFGLPFALLDKLGVVWTTRNWTTVAKLAAFATKE